MLRFVRYSVAMVLFAACGCGGQGDSGAYAPTGTDLTNREGRPQTMVSLDAIPIMQYLPRRSDNYTIETEVKVDGYFYTFTVHSPHGDYTAGSVRDLIRICHEIDAIEEYGKTEQGSAFMQGLKQSACGIGRGAVNLVRHPGQSVKRAGQGVGKLGRAVASPFTRQAPSTAGNGENLELLGAGPGGSERRLFAYELGLDVYTDSPNTQAFIKEVAGKRMMGKLPLSSAVFALPGGAVFTLSLTPMGYDPTTEELIRDNSPGELLRLLSTGFKQNLALDCEDASGPARRFLDNPNFTPRQKAYIYRYLLDLKGIGGIPEAMEFFSKVTSPAYGKIVTAQLEMLALLHSRARKLKALVPVRNTLAGLAADGTLCAIISIDTVRFWPDVEESVKAIVRKAHEIGAKYAEIWSTGDIDEQSAAFAKKYGVSVRQNILRYEIFRKPREAGRIPPAPVREGKSAPAPAPAPQSAPALRAPVAAPLPVPELPAAPAPTAAPDDTRDFVPPPATDKAKKQGEEEHPSANIPQLDY